MEWSLNDILKVFDTGTKLYSVTQQGGSGGAAAGFVDSAAAASSQALTLADMANWRSADTQNRLLDQQERNTARLLDQQERNAGRLLDQQERNTTHTLDFTERTAARGFDLARYLSETFGVNTQRTAGQAFDLAGQLADSTIDSNARTTGQVLDAARGLADSQTSFLSNVLSRTFAQQDQTASLVANSYNDAKGRGAQTDTIIMLAIGGAVLVALLALRKG